MKAVLDVGQFVSATINPHGHPGQILTAWRAGQFELVTAPVRWTALPRFCWRIP